MKVMCHDCKKIKETKESIVVFPIYSNLIELPVKVCLDCNVVVDVPHLSVDKIKKVLKDKRLI